MAKVWQLDSRDSAHCWVNFQGTSTVTVIRSHNVSSVTDLGTGNYRLNFSTNARTSDYAITGMAMDPTNDFPGMAPYRRSDATTNSTQCQVETWYNSSVYDSLRVYIVIHSRK
jgi:hypothetical protein